MSDSEGAGAEKETLPGWDKSATPAQREFQNALGLRQFDSALRGKSQMTKAVMLGKAVLGLRDWSALVKTQLKAFLTEHKNATLVCDESLSGWLSAAQAAKVDLDALSIDTTEFDDLVTCGLAALVKFVRGETKKRDGHIDKKVWAQAKAVREQVLAIVCNVRASHPPRTGRNGTFVNNIKTVLWKDQKDECKSEAPLVLAFCFSCDLCGCLARTLERCGRSGLHLHKLPHRSRGGPSSWL